MLAGIAGDEEEADERHKFDECSGMDIGFAKMGAANEDVLGMMAVGKLEEAEARFVERAETPARGLPSKLRVKNLESCKEAP